MLKMYGYKKCGTCKKAEKYLESTGKKYDFIDITLNPPSLKELTQIFKSSGLPINKLFNVSGELYRSMEIKNKLPQMSEEKALQLLSQYGKLIKRPIVTDGKKVTIGMKEEEFEKVWG
jgi:arsenate reductase